MRPVVRIVCFLCFALCIGCARPVSTSNKNLNGTWLPKEGPSDFLGFELMSNGKGTLTSKQIIEERISQKQPFKYELQGDVLAFKFLDEEGNEGAWQKVGFTLNQDELTLEQVIRPFVAKVFVRSD